METQPNCAHTFSETGMPIILLQLLGQEFLKKITFYRYTHTHKYTHTHTLTHTHSHTNTHTQKDKYAWMCRKPLSVSDSVLLHSLFYDYKLLLLYNLNNNLNFSDKNTHRACNNATSNNIFHCSPFTMFDMLR